MRLSITILTVALLLSGCGLASHFRMLKAYETETISNYPFKKVIPFQDVNGLIVIEVEIEGNRHHFIFDTGATTKLDTNLAAKLKTKKLGRIKTRDSNGKKKYIKYVILNDLKIEGIAFNDLVASVSSLETINKIACVNVSGIIGANAMNKCIWQIDYNSKEITFTNQRDSLHLTENENKSYFSAMGKGTPTISIYSNKEYCGDAIFDTGYNGSINLDEKYMVSNSNFIETQTYSFGLYGSKLTSQKLAIPLSLEFNETIPLDKPLVSFQKNLPFGYIGNDFLKKYKVTFDWMYQEVYLEEYKTTDQSTHRNFGFSIRHIDEKVIIGSINLNSEAHKLGLKLNDRIIKINDIDFSNDIHENYCKYLNDRNAWENIELIIQREKEKKSFQIRKEDLVKQITTQE